MKQDLASVDIGTINDGAIVDLFEEEWKKVMENIQDINTKPDAVREIVIKIRVKPDKLRRTATSMIHVEAKLPTVQDHESFIFFESKEGKMIAYPDDPHQQVLPGIGEIELGKSTVEIH